MVPGSVYQHTPGWYKNFHYIIEQYRGLDHTEVIFLTTASLLLN